MVSSPTSSNEPSTKDTPSFPSRTENKLKRKAEDDSGLDRQRRVNLNLRTFNSSAAVSSLVIPDFAPTAPAVCTPVVSKASRDVWSGSATPGFLGGLPLGRAAPAPELAVVAARPGQGEGPVPNRDDENDGAGTQPQTINPRQSQLQWPSWEQSRDSNQNQESETAPDSTDAGSSTSGGGEGDGVHYHIQNHYTYNTYNNDLRHAVVNSNNHNDTSHNDRSIHDHSNITHYHVAPNNFSELYGIPVASAPSAAASASDGQIPGIPNGVGVDPRKQPGHGYPPNQGHISKQSGRFNDMRCPPLSHNLDNLHTNQRGNSNANVNPQFTFRPASQPQGQRSRAQTQIQQEPIPPQASGSGSGQNKKGKGKGKAQVEDGTEASELPSSLVKFSFKTYSSTIHNINVQYHSPPDSPTFPLNHPPFNRNEYQYIRLSSETSTASTPSAFNKFPLDSLDPFSWSTVRGIAAPKVCAWKYKDETSCNEMLHGFNVDHTHKLLRDPKTKKIHCRWQNCSASVQSKNWGQHMNHHLGVMYMWGLCSKTYVSKNKMHKRVQTKREAKEEPDG
ncbi:hypothetical protein D9758_009044 [Tetrapyrgos nigripes]|uniref:Uncharacterized protein n=1 Tax=Tetrapyrgos nigripes TaxID=182062 RepID=A0A8H5GAG1_9AGAR|nr:hypothetical protein D9758_009044 [Tetrapyrgos nigripes]